MSTAIATDPTTTLVEVWGRWREAVREHVAAIRARGPRPDLDRFPANIRHIDLPTFTALAHTRDAWMDEVARYRRAHPRPGTEGAAFVAKNGHAYEAKCPEHPRFRRVAWTHPSVPTSSAREHNVEHHGGAPVVVMDTPGLLPSTMLPG
jgi:hypothetical protein